MRGTSDMEAIVYYFVLRGKLEVGGRAGGGLGQREGFSQSPRVIVWATGSSKFGVMGPRSSGEGRFEP